ncbi:MAG TPA: MFS transporter, partial [Prolixibacteraceae bacterium]|nr:MFS transporter [Prolixibacteraceae bacterium]
PWFKLLSYRQTWAFSIGKFLTDGVWWFYLFWLPAYMKAQYGLTGMDVAFPLAVLYTLSTIGSITGGWFPMYFIKKGYEPYAGRMRAMLLIAFIPLLVLSAQYLGAINMWMPIFIIGIGTAAHQAWSANIFTTVSDMFPKKAVASVTGIGGMAGGLGGILVNKVAGWVFDAYRGAGIAKSWVEAQAVQLGDMLEKVKSMTLLNKHGDVIDINQVELKSLPTEVVQQIQAAVDPSLFEQLRNLQAPLVQKEMTLAYTFVFIFCALAYLLAWVIMHFLVPKFKKIEL